MLLSKRFDILRTARDWLWQPTLYFDQIKAPAADEEKALAKDFGAAGSMIDFDEEVLIRPEGIDCTPRRHRENPVEFRDGPVANEESPLMGTISPAHSLTIRFKV